MKRLVIFLLVGIFMISFVNAFNWDDVNLKSYYKLDNSSGVVYDMLRAYDGTAYNLTRGVDGKIKNSFSFDGEKDYFDSSTGNEENSFTISAWINISGTSTFNSIYERQSMGSWGRISLRLRDGKVKMIVGDGVTKNIETEYQTILSTNQWYYIVGTYTVGGNISLYVDGILVNYSTGLNSLGISSNTRIGADGNFESGFIGKIDEVGIWNKSLNQSEITELYNDGDGLSYSEQLKGIKVELINPSNNSIVSEDINFKTNSIINDLSNNYNFTNITYNIWYSNGTLFNETTLSITGNSTNQSKLIIGNFTTSNYLWNALTCANNGTETICNSSKNNNTFAWVPFTVVDQIWNNNTFEGSLEEFSIEISVNEGSLFQTASLNYAGVSYPGIITDLGGGNFNITRNITIPQVLVDTNKSFFWSVLFENGFETNTTSLNQTVQNIIFGQCVAGETPFITFNTLEATNPFPDLNATFKSSWELRSSNGGGEVLINESFQDLTGTNNTWSLCFGDATISYTVSSTIEFDNDDHAKNFHYLANLTISNQTTNITLYLLNDSLATLTEFEVVDSSQNGIADVYISIQYYDIGTDTFYTVGMMKTSSEGKDLTYLNWYDSLYKFTLVKLGELIYISTPYKISETPQRFQVPDDYTFDFEKFLNFIYSLDYNDATKNFILTFVKPSGDVDNACLLVTKRNQTGDYEICNVCESSSSATLYCNIENEGNGTFIADFYATGSFSWIYNIFVYIGENEIYNLIGNSDGTVMAIIFSGVVMSMFLFSPIMGVVGLLIGLLGSMALGFQPYQTSTFLFIALLGGFVIFILRK